MASDEAAMSLLGKIIPADGVGIRGTGVRGEEEQSEQGRTEQEESQEDDDPVDFRGHEVRKMELKAGKMEPR